MGYDPCITCSYTDCSYCIYTKAKAKLAVVEETKTCDGDVIASMQEDIGDVWMIPTNEYDPRVTGGLFQYYGLERRCTEDPITFTYTEPHHEFVTWKPRKHAKTVHVTVKRIPVVRQRRIVSSPGQPNYWGYVYASACCARSATHLLCDAGWPEDFLIDLFRLTPAQVRRGGYHVCQRCLRTASVRRWLRRLRWEVVDPAKCPRGFAQLCDTCRHSSRNGDGSWDCGMDDRRKRGIYACRDWDLDPSLAELVRLANEAHDMEQANG